MNSAAVIGRQLRQHKTPAGKGRPRAGSHQPIANKGQAGKEEHEKESTLQSIRNKCSLQCIWAAFKALSGGMMLLMIGTAMSVVGFYAGTLSTENVTEGNRTIEVLDEDRQYHLHNLTYVGPVIMGLGGFVIVAACVMTFEGHDSGAKVVPMKDQRASADTVMLTDHLLKEALNGPSTSGPYLCVPQVAPDIIRTSVVAAREEDKGGGSKTTTVPTKTTINKTVTTTVTKPQVLQVVIPNGPSREQKPPFTLPPRRTPPIARTKSDVSSFQFDEFMPSPQDIDISDPDGCDTPRRSSLASSSMDMEVYLTNCPITVRVQIEPRHLASMESDGLSDSDISDPGEMARAARQFGVTRDETEQEMPLLGRCSPAFSQESRRETVVPLMKRDSARRFPLLRQGALDSCRNLDGQAGPILT